MKVFRYRDIAWGLPLILAFAACGSLDSPSPADSDAVQPPPAPAQFENVRANATAIAANATAQAAYTSATTAREKARESAVQSTAIARATDRAIEVETAQLAIAATTSALSAQSTREAESVNATAEAAVIQRQELARNQTFSTQATAIALSATSTAIAVQATGEIASANWQNNVVLPVSKIAVAILVVLALLGIAYFGIRIFDAIILRVRVIRDPSGHAILIPEPDKAGRRTILLPHRSPGAVLQLTPPNASPVQVLAEAVDAEVTQRAQMIEALGITARRSHASPARVEPPIAKLLSRPQLIRLVSSQQLPPPEIADEHAIQVIDADWRRVNE